MQNLYSKTFLNFYLYSLVPISESGSRQWPLLPIILPAIVFLGQRGINKALLCKMHISFLSVLSQGFITLSLLSNPISESKDQFRITSSEMKLAV